jgi:glycosyltransferase involved in cell wall biosynthesis
MILSVAAHYPHKNLETLVRAFALLCSRRDDVKLVLVGQVSRNLIGTTKARPIETIINATRITEKVYVTGYIDDAEVGSLYSRADAFVFPSLFEGMGRPAVEALGMGLPVLTTRRSALPEMTRGIAQYLEDPFDTEEMALRIEAVLSDRPSYSPTAEDIAKIRQDFSTQTIGRRFTDLLLA